MLPRIITIVFVTLAASLTNALPFLRREAEATPSTINSNLTTRSENSAPCQGTSKLASDMRRKFDSNKETNNTMEGIYPVRKNLHERYLYNGKMYNGPNWKKPDEAYFDDDPDWPDGPNENPKGPEYPH